METLHLSQTNTRTIPFETEQITKIYDEQSLIVN